MMTSKSTYHGILVDVQPYSFYRSKVYEYLRHQPISPSLIWDIHRAVEESHTAASLLTRLSTIIDPVPRELQRILRSSTGGE